MGGGLLLSHAEPGGSALSALARAGPALHASDESRLGERLRWCGRPRKAQVSEASQDCALRGWQGLKPMGYTKGLEGILRPAVGT